jgi:hypothetical protein
VGFFLEGFPRKRRAQLPCQSLDPRTLPTKSITNLSNWHGPKYESWRRRKEGEEWNED